MWSTCSRWLRRLARLLVSGLFLAPAGWILLASVRPVGLPPPRGLEGWLTVPTGANYPELFALLPFGWYLLNSLGLAGVAVPLTLLTASWAGLALAQLKRTPRRWLLAVSVGLLLLPTPALWLTRYVLFAQLGGVKNTYVPVLAPALMGTSPLFVLLFYGTFRQLPRELFEAARLEGASAFSIWWRIALPLARPFVVIVGALAFFYYWGDFIQPWLYLKSPALYTVSVGLQQLQQLDRTNWPLLMAGAVVALLPPALVFFLAQHILQRNHKGLEAGL